MTNTKWLLALVCIFCVATSDKPTSCGPPLSEKCQCTKQYYESVLSYVVNCTNAGFSNSNILQQLPRDTEVIIFRGNNFSSLIRNVFGEKDAPVNLHTIDLTDNNIMDIPGRAFHHVPNVKKLILNNNRIRLSAHGAEHEYVHSRLFSNFLNLTELQLINAFEDGSNEDFPNALLQVFLDSDLSKLTHLHLENNRIRSFESDTFCNIHELKELYLDGNDLTDLNFLRQISTDLKILCLPHLKHISLKSNNINTLNHKTLNVLESFPARKQNLTVDLQCNRWICNSAANLNVTKWLTTTKLLVGKYSCSASNPGCSPEKLGLYASDLSVMAQILIALTVIVFCVVGVVFYFKGTQIRNKFNPLLDTVSHKIQYTTLRRREEPEVDV